MLDPLHQFQITKIIPLSVGSWDISYTNSALWMTIGLSFVCLFFYVSLRKEALVPGRLQASAELTFTFLSDMVKTYIGREGIPFFPFIFTLFYWLIVLTLLRCLRHLHFACAHAFPSTLITLIYC